MTFEWEGHTYEWDGDFPVTIEGPGGTPRQSTHEDHIRRLKMTLKGKWKREYQIGRKKKVPKLGIWFFEWTHALKNVVVEHAREKDWWNRKNRDPKKPDGYVFPRR